MLTLLLALPGCNQSLPAGEPAEDYQDAGGHAEGAQRCVVAPGARRAPETLKEAVELINGLPRPVSLSCFLQSLERPLHLNATSSTTSAQPAAGQLTPRLFLLSGSLVLSVVGAGPSHELLELSELVSDTRSVKAEIVFPVTEDVGATTLKLRVERDAGTVCGLCHSAETPASEGHFEGAFESGALRPNPNKDVPLDAVRAEADACPMKATSERCRLLNALFNFGDVRAGEFPAAMPFWAGL